MAVTAVFVLRDRPEDGGTETTGSLPGRGVIFQARRLGITGVRPPTWRVKRSRRAIRLTSPDRAGLVAISATPFSVGTRALMSSTLAAVRRSYRGVRLTRVQRTRLGGIPGSTSGGTATNSRRIRLDLVVAAAKGKRRSYLLQVFVARQASGRRLAEAQTILNSLELSG